MPQAASAIYVEGQAIGAYWSFEARCFVYDYGIANWRKATAGEVECELWEYHWGILPDVLLGRKDVDGGGNALFNAAMTYPAGHYLLSGQHKVSGSKQTLKIETREDGTWEILESY